MRIPFRIKFFVVLLAFSLGPIFISRGIMGRTADGMANDLSKQSRSELLEIVSSELEYNAVSLLTILQAQGQTMKLGVRMLAQQAGRFLNMEPLVTSKPVFSIDFADPDLAPKDTTSVFGYERQTMSGKTRSLPVSFEKPAFFFPPRVREEDIADQSSRLQGLSFVLKEIYGTLAAAPYWFNVSLESGTFMTYPGHGSIPMIYDPRDQEWYKKTLLQPNECAWTSPVVDPVTRRAMTTVGFPVTDTAGDIVGVASIDVPISFMLSDSNLKSRWSGDIRSFMVSREPQPTAGGDGLYIVAQHSYDEGGRRHWMTGIEREKLVSDDDEGFEKLLQMMVEKPSGVVHLPYKGEPSVWAYASGSDISFLLIAPETVVFRLPDEVSGSLAGLFEEMRDISAIISGIMLIITGLIAWFGSRAVTRPLLTMADAVGRLAKGDFSAHLDLRTGDERDIFIDAFNNMGPKLKELMLISKDLELAQEVQKMLLPRAKPLLVGYDISGGIAYCDQTGGDYYDFIKVNCESGCDLGVVLGDVSGHGVPSALIMATARGQLHSLAKVSMAPEARIEAINKFLSNDLDGTGRFLTLFYLEISSCSDVVRWVRAGHDPAIRYSPKTGEFSELGGDGLALGVVAEFEFQGYEAVIEAGEVLTLATDGVWEARNLDGEMFGKKRMLAIIQDNAHKCAEDIRKAIMNGVSAYHGNGQEDDIAVVVIKKRVDGTEMADNSISFRMTNKENCFKCFQPKVEEFGESNGLALKVIFHLTLCLDELVTNLISYGYADYDEHPIDVTISLTDDIITIRIEDDSEPFNIFDAPEPELDVPLEEREKPIGGMGVHLVKNMVDEIEYKREEDKNILILKKKICEECYPV